jgi:hypothetical protein
MAHGEAIFYEGGLGVVEVVVFEVFVGGESQFF